MKGEKKLRYPPFKRHKYMHSLDLKMRDKCFLLRWTIPNVTAFFICIFLAFKLYTIPLWMIWKFVQNAKISQHKGFDNLLGCRVIIEFFIKFRALWTIFSIILVFFVRLSDHRVTVQLLQWQKVVDNLGLCLFQRFQKFYLSCVDAVLTGFLLKRVAKENELLKTWQLSHELKLLPISEWRVPNCL